MSFEVEIPSLYVDKTALLVIDMQNSFCHPQGSIGRAGADVSLMTATIAPVARLLQTANDIGMLHVWTIQEHYPDDVTRYAHRVKPHTLRHGGGPAALTACWESEIVDELKPYAEPPAELVRKHRFSGFLDTRLRTLLRMKGIDTLLICGVSTTLCVETTVRDAYQLDFDVILATDAVGTSTLEEHNNSLKTMQRWFCVGTTTEDLIERMRAATPFEATAST